jgi:hypothetical protein
LHDVLKALADSAAGKALRGLGAYQLAGLALAAALLLAVPLVAQVWEPGDPLPAPAGNREDGLDIPADGSPVRPPAAAPRVLYPAPPRQVPDAEPDLTTSATAGHSKPAPLSVAEDPDDFLCSRAPAGKAVPIPPPFDRWLVLVCTRDGQALVPVEGEAWVVRGSADIVSLFALPPGTEAPPRGAGFDARYDLRFLAISGGEAKDDRRERALSLLRLATRQSEQMPDIRDVWQLDAISNAGDTRYNIFFYRTGERPVRIIACLDGCMKALHLDVLSGLEAKEVLGHGRAQ